MAVVPDMYIDRRFIRHKKGVWRRILWWMPTLAMIAYTLVFVFDRDFAPADVIVLNVYMFLLPLGFGAVAEAARMPGALHRNALGG